jgi:hypothetical protein
LTASSRKFRLSFLAVLGVLVLVAVPAALAAIGGKPGGGGGTTGGGGSSLSLVVMDGATQPAHGGRVTFTVSTSATATPEVGLRCYQGPNWVYDNYVGYFPAYMFDQWFTLDSLYWEAGVPATCNARLFSRDRRGRENVLATLSFDVAP